MNRDETLRIVHRAVARLIAGQRLPELGSNERDKLREATHHLADSGDFPAFTEIGIRAVRAVISASLSDLAQRQRLDDERTAAPAPGLH